VIGVDSNLVLRWLLNDDPHQTRRAASIFKSGETIFISHLVLAETAWVLSRTYRLPREVISRAMRAVVTMPDAEVQDRNVILSALAAYETGGPGLVDQMIGHLNHAAGCRTTLTFDKQAGEGNLFTSVV
jgi:predicted nucleic-acid-binding protein